MPRTKGSRNKPKRGERKPRKQRPLSKQYREIAPDMVRIIARPYANPPQIFRVTTAEVFVHRCNVWDATLKARLQARGYSVRMDNRSTLVFEKTVARKDSQ
jgi:hypothetical protein